MIPLGLFRAAQGGGGGTVEITADQIDLNLLELWEASNPPAQAGDTVNFVCDPSLIFAASVQSSSSLNNAPPSIRTGVWPAGVNLNLIIPNCEATGAGGRGNGPNQGAKGGTAFLAESPINVDAPGSEFNGGGGGGAGTDQAAVLNNTYQAGGGGGAGRPGGDGWAPTGSTTNKSPGQPGTATFRGEGGNFGSDPNQPTVCGQALRGGNGGNLGQPGQDASDTCRPGSVDNIGGPAGFSVDGLSLVTWVTAPTLVGPTNG